MHVHCTQKPLIWTFVFGSIFNPVPELPSGPPFLPFFIDYVSKMTILGPPQKPTRAQNGALGGPGSAHNSLLGSKVADILRFRLSFFAIWFSAPSSGRPRVDLYPILVPLGSV